MDILDSHALTQIYSHLNFNSSLSFSQVNKKINHSRDPVLNVVKYIIKQKYPYQYEKWLPEATISSFSELVRNLHEKKLQFVNHNNPSENTRQFRISFFVFLEKDYSLFYNTPPWTRNLKFFSIEVYLIFRRNIMYDIKQSEALNLNFIPIHDSFVVLYTLQYYIYYIHYKFKIHDDYKSLRDKCLIILNQLHIKLNSIKPRSDLNDLINDVKLMIRTLKSIP